MREPRTLIFKETYKNMFSITVDSLQVFTTYKDLHQLSATQICDGLIPSLFTQQESPNQENHTHPSTSSLNSPLSLQDTDPPRKEL